MVIIQNGQTLQESVGDIEDIMGFVNSYLGETTDSRRKSKSDSDSSLVDYVKSLTGNIFKFDEDTKSIITNGIDDITQEYLDGNRR